MITYIVNTLLCAAVLLLVYFLLLEREKMHRFNRFYLLFSILFSFTVSFITIKSTVHVAAVSEMIVPSTQQETVLPATELHQTPAATPVEESNLIPNLLLGIYLSVTAYLLIRFTRNLAVLMLKVIRNKKVAYHGAFLVLTNDNAIPHSFLNYIFIDKAKFELGTIEKEILQHELTHVNQKHSIDILMVELLLVFAWINPFLFLYRKAILLNHEYLADEAVVNTFHDAPSYQLLLFNKVSQRSNLILSSPFNYLITKKRLIMMTRKTSQKVAILKQIALIPLIAAIAFLFSTRVIAQDKQYKTVPSFLWDQPGVKASKKDAPQSVIAEYQAMIAKYKFDTTAIRNRNWNSFRNPKEFKEWRKSTNMDNYDKYKKTDQARLESLYTQMSKMQQGQQLIQFFARVKTFPKLIPTKEQVVSWKNSKTFVIRMNDKMVKNSVLNNHSNTDFSFYDVTAMSEKSAKVKNIQYEVILMTNDYYEKERIRMTTDKDKDGSKYNLVLVMPPMNGKGIKKNSWSVIRVN